MTLVRICGAVIAGSIAWAVVAAIVPFDSGLLWLASAPVFAAGVGYLAPRQGRGADRWAIIGGVFQWIALGLLFALPGRRGW